MKVYNYIDNYSDEKIYIKCCNYHNGNLCLQSFCEDGEPFARLSVNFPHIIAKYCFYADVNNVENLCSFLIENGIAKPVLNKFVNSGFIIYPLFKLTNEFIKENNL